MRWLVDSAAATPLSQQIAANVRRGIATAELNHGERMPTAKELAELLDVNSNTVLAAYRALRDEGILEFRRGRPARVIGHASDVQVVEAARALVSVARLNGYSSADLRGLLGRVEAEHP